MVVGAVHEHGAARGRREDGVDERTVRSAVARSEPLSGLLRPDAAQVHDEPPAVGQADDPDAAAAPAGDAVGAQPDEAHELVAHGAVAGDEDGNHGQGPVLEELVVDGADSGLLHGRADPDEEAVALARDLAQRLDAGLGQGRGPALAEVQAFEFGLYPIGEYVAEKVVLGREVGIKRHPFHTGLKADVADGDILQRPALKQFERRFREALVSQSSLFFFGHGIIIYNL